MMEVLQKEGILIKDRVYVENILLQLKNGGASQLQVISDFDHTLSRVHMDSKTCETTYGVLKNSPFSSQDYLNQSLGLYKHYHPIENDPNISKAEKIPLMLEWYTKSIDLMKISMVSKDQIPDMVKTCNAHLREGCQFMFESLNRKNVPLLIFSAGIGDIMIELLQQQKLLLPNMKIIANFMKFNEQNKLVGFNNALIHTFNKSDVSLQNMDYFNGQKSRNNVILLGDTLGDIDMAEGVQNVNALLKIGFLNSRIEENTTTFLDSYDIVLVDDQTVNVINEILKNIL